MPSGDARAGESPPRARVERTRHRRREAREAARAVKRYAEQLGLTFPLVLDATGKINDLYGVIGLPTTFLVARDGRAVAFAVGPRAWGSPPARALLETLLAEPLPRAP